MWLNLTIDLFLWPMLVPLFIILVYSFFYKRESFKELVIIAFSMVVIVIVYWPLTEFFVSPANIGVKFLLFVFLPVIFLVVFDRGKQRTLFKWYGLQYKGLQKSILFCLMFLPIMLFTTYVVQYYVGGVSSADVFLGSVSFIESFTEEFFFRGILFLFLWRKLNLSIAYVVSLSSFVLMHPQNFMNLYLLITIVQGVLTIEISRRSKNLTGAWILHGANRFFTIAVIPLFIPTWV